MTNSWSNNGLDAVKLRLCRSPSSAQQLHDYEHALDQSFPPAFVYPIYGQEEVIYGYDSLTFTLNYTSGSLKQFLDLSYKAKLPETGDVKPDDVEGLLYPHIPADYTKSKDTFDQWVIQDEASFKPFGTKIGSYARKPKQPVNGKGKGKAAQQDLDDRPWVLCEESDDGAVVYEAFQANFDTPGFREYHRRMQPFILFYIEGGAYIDEEDDRWEFVTFYEKRSTPAGETYHFMGYTSLYRFLHWPDKTRLRLAQFVILPPYQGSGHGSQFYSMLYLNILTRASIAELTVEDPSEAFQDMRDKVDLQILLSTGAFKDLKAPVEKSKQKELRAAVKLGDRQFSRLLEMALKLELDPSDRKGTKDYRLMVKERLFRFNHELLSSMDKKERTSTLQQTYDSVVEEYDRLLEQFAT